MERNDGNSTFSSLSGSVREESDDDRIKSGGAFTEIKLKNVLVFGNWFGQNKEFC